MYCICSSRNPLISILVYTILITMHANASGFSTRRKRHDESDAIALKDLYDDSYHRHLESLQQNAFLVDDDTDYTKTADELDEPETETEEDDMIVLGKTDMGDTESDSEDDDTKMEDVEIEERPRPRMNTKSTMADTLDFSKLLPQEHLVMNAAKLFKRISQELSLNRNKIKVGGLYDEYKKRLQAVLDNGMQIRLIKAITSERDYPLYSDSEVKPNDNAKEIKAQQMLQDDHGVNETEIPVRMELVKSEHTIRTTPAPLTGKALPKPILSDSINIASILNRTLAAVTRTEKPKVIEIAKTETSNAADAGAKTINKTAPKKVAPAKSEPDKVEPAKVEPAKVEPAKVEPTKVEPAKVEPAKVESVKVKQAKVESAKVEPAKVEPTKSDPVKVALPAKPAPPGTENNQKAATPQLQPQKAVNISYKTAPIPKQQQQQQQQQQKQQWTPNIMNPMAHTNFQRLLNSYLIALDHYKKVKSQLFSNITSQFLETNPFYLPNSKMEQTVYSKVPMMPSVSGKPDDFQTLAFKMQRPLEVYSKLPFLDDKIQKPTPPTPIPYSGLDNEYIRQALQKFAKAPIQNLYDEYQNQLDRLNSMLKAKQRWWEEARSKGLLSVPNSSDEEDLAENDNNEMPLNVERNARYVPDAVPMIPQQQQQHQPQTQASSDVTKGGLLANALEMAMNPATPGQGNVLTKLANRLNITPTEVAEKLANAANSNDPNFAVAIKNYLAKSMNQATASSALAANAYVPRSATPQVVMPSYPTAPPYSQAIAQYTQPKSPNMMSQDKTITLLAPILDKILAKVEHLQALKFYQNVEPNLSLKEDSCETPANPTDGAPCNLIGSWESQFLSVRFDITESPPTPQSQNCTELYQHCVPSKLRVLRSICGKHMRQCSGTSDKTEEIPLDIYVREIVPPRPHELIEHINNWCFGADAANLFGGPIILTARKLGTSLMATFIGFCRNCGCIDTIHGSWTFCMPSRDCQDVNTAIFEKRDILRRYKMNENRKERYKDILFNRSDFFKTEREKQKHA